MVGIFYVGGYRRKRWISCLKPWWIWKTVTSMFKLFSYWYKKYRTGGGLTGKINRVFSRRILFFPSKYSVLPVRLWTSNYRAGVEVLSRAEKNGVQIFNFSLKNRSTSRINSLASVCHFLAFNAFDNIYKKTISKVHFHIVRQKEMLQPEKNTLEFDSHLCSGRKEGVSI